MFKKRNIVSADLAGLESAPMTVRADARRGDLILVMSDGVHDNLTHQEIEMVCAASTDPDTLGKRLAAAAWTRARSNHLRAKDDDITAAVLAV
jgi:serine/threonine protein phosphatase PrpC